MTATVDDGHLTTEDRAAIRAYLQRSEVRLSTVHRVASALLSGAGLMVLLPAIERDAVVVVLRHLLSGPARLIDGLLVVAVLASIAVPFVAIGLLLRDLTTFYFHANHLRGADGRDAFTPRFTLTGLQLPDDELSPSASTALGHARTDPNAVQLLVPDNDASRAAIDARTGAYGLTADLHESDRTASRNANRTSDRTAETRGPAGDLDRADALFALAASHPRPLLEEVSKVEHGMARHVLGIQVIVLRYAKALLALLATALCAFSASAVVESSTEVGSGEEVWLAGILLVWAPLAVVAVATPVWWLENRLRSEGAASTAVSRDKEMTAVERATIALALVGFAAAFSAMVVVLLTGEPTAVTGWVGAATAAVTVLAMGAALYVWVRRTRAVTST